MGCLNIGAAASIQLDDDLLAHVHTVIVAKLRRNEPVLVQWTDGDGHLQEVWVHPTSVVLVRFDSSSSPELDRSWLDRLMTAANSVSGISLDVADLHRHSAAVVPCVPHVVRHDHPVRPTAAGA